MVGRFLQFSGSFSFDSKLFSPLETIIKKKIQPLSPLQVKAFIGHCVKTPQKYDKSSTSNRSNESNRRNRSNKVIEVMKVMEVTEVIK